MENDWKHRIAVEIEHTLTEYPQSLERFREQAKVFCSAYQEYLVSRGDVDPPCISDDEFDALLIGIGLVVDKKAFDIPPDPIRGGEYYKRPTETGQTLPESYTALAVLHDHELENDRRILDDQSIYCRAVCSIISKNNHHYNKDFFEIALSKIENDLNKSKMSTDEQLLASRIIDNLNEWLSIGSIENWLGIGLNESVVEQKLPTKYRPNRCLDYRLDIRNKLWMDSVILQLKANGKEGLADEIEQRQKKFISAVSIYDEELKPSDPLHLPNRQLNHLAACLRNALEKALPCLGKQLSESKSAGTGQGKKSDKHFQGLIAYIEKYQSIVKEVGDSITDYQAGVGIPYIVTKEQTEWLNFNFHPALQNELDDIFQFDQSKDIRDTIDVAHIVLSGLMNKKGYEKYNDDGCASQDIKLLVNAHNAVGRIVSKILSDTPDTQKSPTKKVGMLGNSETGQRKIGQDVKKKTEQQTTTPQFMSVAQLAEIHDLTDKSKEALRKRLERLRQSNMLMVNQNIFREVNNPGSRQPKFLYNREQAEPIIEKLKAKMSGERPVKK